MDNTIIGNEFQEKILILNLYGTRAIISMEGLPIYCPEHMFLLEAVNRVYYSHMVVYINVIWDYLMFNLRKETT